MLLLGKEPHSINAADIRRLVEERLPESASLEYKEAAYSRDKRDNFLADVSAFANSSGGFILLGVKCEDGIPVGAEGLPAESVDDAWLQMGNWLRDCLDPRIDGIVRQDVDMGNGNRVLIVGIPKSWNQPHMLRGSGRFYVRTNAGNEPCDCGQVRSLVQQGSDVMRSFREWRAERISTLLSGNGPERPDLPNAGKGGTVLVSVHLAPLVSLSGSMTLDLVASNPPRLNPMVWSTGNQDRYCFEGMLWDAIESPSMSPQVCTGYTLLSRDGRIESVSAAVIRPAGMEGNDTRLFYGHLVEDRVLDFLKKSLSLYRTVGVSAPLVVSLEILRAREYATIQNSSYIPHNLRPFGRDVLAFPEVLVRDTNETPATFMRPVFDTMWNASGWPSSPNYNDDGSWKKPR